jgi:hypothetical protein
MIQERQRPPPLTYLLGCVIAPWYPSHEPFVDFPLLERVPERQTKGTGSKELTFITRSIHAIFLEGPKAFPKSPQGVLNTAEKWMLGRIYVVGLSETLSIR